MVCGSDHLATHNPWVLVVVQDGLDVLILDLSPKTIGAEEESISSLELDREDVDLDVALGSHSTEEYVGMRVVAGLIG